MSAALPGVSEPGRALDAVGACAGERRVLQDVPRAQELGRRAMGVLTLIREHPLDHQRRLHLAEHVAGQAAFDVDAQPRHDPVVDRLLDRRDRRLAAEQRVRGHCERHARPAGRDLPPRRFTDRLAVDEGDAVVQLACLAEPLDLGAGVRAEHRVDGHAHAQLASEPQARGAEALGRLDDVADRRVQAHPHRHEIVVGRQLLLAQAAQVAVPCLTVARDRRGGHEHAADARVAQASDRRVRVAGRERDVGEVERCRSRRRPVRRPRRAGCRRRRPRARTPDRCGSAGARCIRRDPPSGRSRRSWACQEWRCVSCRPGIAIVPVASTAIASAPDRSTPTASIFPSETRMSPRARSPTEGSTETMLAPWIRNRAPAVSRSSTPVSRAMVIAWRRRARTRLRRTGGWPAQRPYRRRPAPARGGAR